MKNWLTNSMASMPKSFLAIRGKSRLEIFPPLSARWSDHSAREILNNELGSFMEVDLFEAQPAPRVIAATVQCWRKRRRLVEVVIRFPLDLRGQLKGLI